MASTYTPIATQTLGSAASSVTFSSIPSTYTDLRIIVTVTTSTNGADIVMQFNGDTTYGNYFITQISGNGSTASSATASYPFLAGTTSSTVPTPALGDIMNYTNTTTYKTWLSRSGDMGNGYVQADVGFWKNTSAINQILIKTVNNYNFNTGSTFTLYGIKAA